MVRGKRKHFNGNPQIGQKANTAEHVELRSIFTPPGKSVADEPPRQTLDNQKPIFNVQSSAPGARNVYFSTGACPETCNNRDLARRQTLRSRIDAPLNNSTRHRTKLYTPAASASGLFPPAITAILTISAVLPTPSFRVALARCFSMVFTLISSA